MNSASVYAKKPVLHTSGRFSSCLYAGKAFLHTGREESRHHVKEQAGKRRNPLLEIQGINLTPIIINSRCQSLACNFDTATAQHIRIRRIVTVQEKRGTTIEIVGNVRQVRIIDGYLPVLKILIYIDSAISCRRVITIPECSKPNCRSLFFLPLYL